MVASSGVAREEIDAVAKSLSTDEAVQHFRRISFHDLPAERRVLLLAERAIEDGLTFVPGCAVEADLLRWAEDLGLHVAGARWSDGTLGVVTWRKQDGPEPDQHEIRVAYAVASRWNPWPVNH